MGGHLNAVLNPHLTVRRAAGLQVVGASAFPDRLSGHINASVMALAERGADLVRGRPPLALANV